MRTVAFVPIKFDSERCHLKNIRSFTNGEPLISYILKTLLKIKEIDDIYVYCSSEQILGFLPNGVNWVQRDKKYDSQTASFNELIESFTKLIDADTYVLAHATSPFISNNSIAAGIKAVNEDGYDSAFTVIEIREFLWSKDKPLNYCLENIPRTQDLDLILMETCGLYIFKKQLITQRHRRIGFSPYIIPVSRVEGWDIDTEEDFWIADALYNFMRSK